MRSTPSAHRARHRGSRHGGRPRRCSRAGRCGPRVRLRPARPGLGEHRAVVAALALARTVPGR